MTYRMFKKTNQKVSLLGFGAMRFPTTPEGKIEPIRSEKMIDIAYKNGVNYFDTAYMYHDGESQSFLGKVMKKYPRDSFFITNKFPLWMCDGSDDMERIFNDQLEKCGVEYFDFYLVHAMDAGRLTKMAEYKLYEFLAEKKAKGQIRELGFSFHDTPEVLEEICHSYDWDFAQIQLNYLDWDLQRANEMYDILCKYELPCVIMEPVRGGSLASLPTEAEAVLKAYHPEASIASWAIKFCASLPNVLTVLSGMSTEEQVNDNLHTMQDFTPLTQEEQDAIQKALAIYKKVTLIPCTACRYCVDCPVTVAIPDVFKHYNDYKLSNNKEDFVSEMKKIVDSDGSACITCGACVEKCPQKIDIPNELTRIQTLLAELSR